MPSILKSKNAPITQKDVIIIPQITKQPSSLSTHDKTENMRPIILPHFTKMDKNRISKTQVATEKILLPSIIRNKPLSLNENQPIDQPRRSTREKKPPDKLRY